MPLQVTIPAPALIRNSFINCCPNDECYSGSIYFLKVRKKWKCWSCHNIFKKPQKRLNTSANYTTKRNYKRDTLIMSRIELLNCIENINELNSNDILRDKALISILYLSGCRITEIVGSERHRVPAMLRKQIGMYELDGASFLNIFEVPTLKRRNYLKRSIPIYAMKESPFIENIINYINEIDENRILFINNRDTALSRAYVFKICIKHTTFSPHYFRHLRATHLVTEYKFTDSELVKFFGWKDSRMAEFYIHLRSDDIARKMIGDK